MSGIETSRFVPIARGPSNALKGDHGTYRLKMAENAEAANFQEICSHAPRSVRKIENSTFRRTYVKYMVNKRIRLCLFRDERWGKSHPTQMREIRHRGNSWDFSFNKGKKYFPIGFVHITVLDVEKCILVMYY